MSNDDVYQAQPVHPEQQYRTQQGGGGSNMGIFIAVLGGCCIGLFAIVGILIALLIPATQAAREAARRMQCSNNEKQIVIAFHNYHDTYNVFPPAYTVDSEGKPLHSWRVIILPYLEQQALYDQIKKDEPWDSPFNSQFHKMMPSAYACPSRPQIDHMQGLASYQMIVGPDTISDGAGQSSMINFVRGTSNTIAIAESAKPVNWMEPKDIPLSALSKGIIPSKKARDEASGEGIGSFHSGGANIAVCDGSVRFISETISPAELETMSKKK